MHKYIKEMLEKHRDTLASADATRSSCIKHGIILERRGSERNDWCAGCSSDHCELRS